MGSKRDSYDELMDAINDAVAGETPKRVCSTLACEGVPVTRFSLSPDESDLLCVACLATSASVWGVVSATKAIDDGLVDRLNQHTAERLAIEAAQRYVADLEAL